MRYDEKNAEKTPEFICLSEVEPKPLYWLWFHRIALGKLTLIVGDPGGGKSFLTLSMAAHVSAGIPWPDTPDQENPPGDVILLSAEDDVEDTILPRLIKMKADRERITVFRSVEIDNGDDEYSRLFDLGNDIEIIEKMLIERPDCRLIIIDPISAYIGTGRDGNSNTDVRSLLAPLAEIAARSGIAVVAVSHLTKAGTANPIYRVLGSIAWGAASRCVWTVVPDDHSDDDGNDRPLKRRRLFLPVKNNLTAMEGTGLAFSIDDEAVVWDTLPIGTTAAEHFQRQFEQSNRRGPQPRARKEAERWLCGVLENGPKWVTEIQEQAEQEGISWRTVGVAKRQLGIVSERVQEDGPGRWYWRKADQPQEPPPQGDHQGGHTVH